MKLVKDIVPVDEQLGDPGKFDLNIDGEGGYDASKSDAVDGDSVELTVPNGSVDSERGRGHGHEPGRLHERLLVHGAGPRGGQRFGHLDQRPAGRRG